MHAMRKGQTMRDDIKLFVYRDANSPDLIIRVRSMDGMNEQVTVDGRDMELCRDAHEKGQLLAKAIRDLADMTILSAEDLLRMSAADENAKYCREFMFPKPRIVREPEPEPELQTGWLGFLNGVTEAILKAHKNYVFPRARVVKRKK